MISNVSSSAINNADSSLQQAFAISTFKSNLDFQASMVNQLINGSLDSGDATRTAAMNEMGKGLRINTAV